MLSLVFLTLSPSLLFMFTKGTLLTRMVASECSEGSTLSSSISPGKAFIKITLKDFFSSVARYDSKLLEAERQEQLGDWGFTAVRLGSMWSGVEPVEGQVNETYIDILTEIVSGLEKQGIYTYLDMHQVGEQLTSSLSSQ